MYVDSLLGLLYHPSRHPPPSSIQLVFVSSAFGQLGSFDTFSVQHLSLLSIQYQQPYFGSNYIALDIKPAPAGGLTEGAKAELRLKDKGIFELSGALEKSREMALYKKRDELLNQPELRGYKCSAIRVVATDTSKPCTPLLRITLIFG